MTIFQIDRIIWGDSCGYPPNPGCGTNCDALYLGLQVGSVREGVCVCVTASDMMYAHSVHGSQVGPILTSDAFWSWSKEVPDPTNVY